MGKNRNNKHQNNKSKGKLIRSTSWRNNSIIPGHCHINGAIIGKIKGEIISFGIDSRLTNIESGLHKAKVNKTKTKKNNTQKHKKMRIFVDK